MMLTPKTLVVFFCQCSLLASTNFSNEILKHLTFLRALIYLLHHLLAVFLVSSSTSSHLLSYTLIRSLSLSLSIIITSFYTQSVSQYGWFSRTWPRSSSITLSNLRLEKCQVQLSTELVTFWTIFPSKEHCHLFVYVCVHMCVQHLCKWVVILGNHWKCVLCFRWFDIVVFALLFYYSIEQYHRFASVWWNHRRIKQK